jgi:hypothetical protein
MKMIRQIEDGKHPRGIFLCEICNNEVEAGKYAGKKAKSCSKCRYIIRENPKKQKYINSKYKHIVEEGTKSPLYSVWKSMVARCYNANNPNFGKYGAKGITVCDEWKDSYVTYAEWMLDNGYDLSLRFGEYKHRHSIDRIDSSKGYSPDNCQVISVSANSSRVESTKRIAVYAYKATDGSYYASYSSLTEAARALNVQVNHLPEILDETASRKQAGGYMFSLEKVDKMEVPKNIRVTSSFEAFDKEGNSVGIYKTKKEFAEKYDVAGTNIAKVLNGKRKHTKGFTFKYL